MPNHFETRVILTGSKEAIVSFKAQHFIHHQYFIWERDELTAKMKDIMLDRLANGVEVPAEHVKSGLIQSAVDADGCVHQYPS